MKKLLLISLFICLSSSLLAETTTKKSYGNAVVKKIYDSNDTAAYVFKCDIKNYPPIIGKNIPIRINGLTEPNNITSTQKQNIKQSVLKKLNSAKTIRLRNMKRDEDFCILADVFVDNKNITDVITNTKSEVPPKPKDPPVIKTKPQLQTSLYVGSKKSKVFHKKNCRWVDSISKENIAVFENRNDAINKGKRPCKTCKP